MNRYTHSLLLFAALAASSAKAADAPPSPPLVRPAPERMHLEIQFEQPSPVSAENQDDATLDPARPDLLRSVSIRRTGPIREVISNSTRSGRRTYWILGGFIFSEQRGGRSSFSVEEFSPGVPTFLTRGANVIYGTGWISEKNYVGLQDLNGVPCHYYEDSDPNWEGAGPQPDDLTAVEGSKDRFVRKAWIHAETRLPVAAELPDGKCTYEFHPPPSQMLQPPAEYMRYAQQLRAEIERQTREATQR